jgi:hypothetical protein
MSKEDLFKHLSVDKKWLIEAEEKAEKSEKEIIKELITLKHRPEPLSIQDKVIGYPVGYRFARFMTSLTGQPEIKEKVEETIKKYKKDPHWKIKLNLERAYRIIDNIEFKELFNFYQECQHYELEAIVEKWIKKVAIPAYIGAKFIAYPADQPKENRDEDKDLEPRIL